MHRGRAGAARGEGGRPAAAAASAARAAAWRFGAAHGSQGASGRCGGGGARDTGLVCLPDHARAARGPGCHRRWPNLRAARNHKLARAARHLPPHGGDARAHPPHTKRDGALPHPRVGRAAPPRRALSLEAPREWPAVPLPLAGRRTAPQRQAPLSANGSSTMHRPQPCRVPPTASRHVCGGSSPGEVWRPCARGGPVRVTLWGYGTCSLLGLTE
mmetsp:Transcript_20202/g.64543  ORF Transcript_20202/g.64543 Transcript_20202/m.64543 type:complete len:215 (-) Transcript_20202:30-674(-)